MNTRYIFPLAVSALFLGSCATQQVATRTDQYDDVYYSKAKAVDKPVYTSRVPEGSEYRQGSTNYDDAYYYDDSYSNRLDRFYSYSPWRTYYDPFWGGYYGNSLAMSPYYGGLYGGGLGFGNYGYGIGLGLSFGSPFGYYNPYSYWGPNSFYNYYGGGYNAWGGGYYGLGGYPGYYGGGVGIVNNGNYRARPTRSGDGAGYINTGRPMGTGVGRTGYVTDRSGNIMPIDRSSRTRGGYGNPVDRSGVTQQRQRPERIYEAPPRQEQPQRVERSYPSSPQPSSGGGGGYSGGGGGGGGRSRGGRG